MALRAGLAGYLACAMFTTRLWAEDLWILLGLSICLGSASDHVEFERSEQSAPTRFTALETAAPGPPTLARESATGHLATDQKEPGLSGE